MHSITSSQLLAPHSWLVRDFVLDSRSRWCAILDNYNLRALYIANRVDLAILIVGCGIGLCGCMWESAKRASPTTVTVIYIANRVDLAILIVGCGVGVLGRYGGECQKDEPNDGDYHSRDCQAKIHVLVFLPNDVNQYGRDGRVSRRKRCYHRYLCLWISQ